MDEEPVTDSAMLARGFLHCRYYTMEGKANSFLNDKGINSRVCKIVEDAFVESTEEGIEGETCKQLDTPTTASCVHECVTFDQCGELIDNYDAALVTSSESCGDKEMKVMPFLSLGCENYGLGHHEKSIAYFEKAAELGKEMDDKEMESRAYGNLAVVLESIGQEDKSSRCREKALDLIQANEGTDLKQRCALYNKQGMLYHGIRKYEKSISCHKRSLELSEELCDKQEEAISHFNLGTVYCTVGEYEKSIEHNKKCFEIRRTMADIYGQAISCMQLAYLYYMKSEYHTSIDYQKIALERANELGEKEMEATSYNNLGCLFQALRQFHIAIEYYELCGSMHMDSEQTCGELRKTFRHLSGLLYTVGAHREATGWQERSFPVGEDSNEFICSSSDYLQEEIFEIIEVMEGNENDRFYIPRKGRSYTSQLNVKKATEYSSESIKRHEELRFSHNDEIKISLDNEGNVLYKTQASIFISCGKPNAALFTLEQGRAHAVNDLIMTRHGSKTTPNTTTTSIHSDTLRCLIQKQKCSFLFMAFLMKNLFLWFIDKECELHLKQYSDPDPKIKNTKDLLETLSKETLETMMTEEEADKTPNEEEDRERRKKRDLCLRRLYKDIIAPIAHLIEREGPDSEIIIIPEGQMFLVPFAALKDENGKYLSDKVRIRIIPSLTTLKLIHDYPADYHCQSKALIVGVPEVGVKGFRPLKCAKEEAEMIAKLLGEPCLVGEQATKKEVLRRIQEVDLIHIVTHGAVESGEPALALGLSDSKEPVMLEDFVLTVEEIARLKIRAKLVVLSFCFSGRGKVMAGEGVVGAARAFLGSGARSVLVSLWQVHDEATKTFMYIFYKYLQEEKMSASEALQRTQKEMRSPKWGYDDEQDWASFTLLGDDVTLD